MPDVLPVGDRIWTDGNKIYYSSGASDQGVLDIDDNTWYGTVPNNFYDLAISGYYVWNDGTNIYYSYDSSQEYVLNNYTINCKCKLI